MLTRSQIGFYLEDIETPIGRTVNLTITGLILLSSASFTAETYPLSGAVRLKLQTLDTALLVVFTIEYLVRLWCADRKFKFVFSFFSIVDLVAIVPFLLGFVNVSFIRIFRWFRILRLIRFLELKNSVFRISSEDGVIFSRILFTLLGMKN